MNNSHENVYSVCEEICKCTHETGGVHHLDSNSRMNQERKYGMFILATTNQLLYLGNIPIRFVPLTQWHTCVLMEVRLRPWLMTGWLYNMPAIFIITATCIISSAHSCCKCKVSKNVVLFKTKSKMSSIISFFLHVFVCECITKHVW